MLSHFLLVILVKVAMSEQRACPDNLLRCGSSCFNAWDATCCGDTTITNGNKQLLCCNGTVLSTNGNENLQCCGAGLYNWRNSRCCSSGYSIPIDYECCKNAPNGYINGSEEICCNGNPSPYTPDVNACCGGQAYNRNTAKCCSAGGKNTLLAMDGAFNRGLCCVVRKSMYGRIAKSRPYSDKTHICCGGKIVKFTKQCCGRTVLSDDQLCCSGVPVDKRGRFSNACCFKPSENIFQTYDSPSEFCDRAGNVHSNITLMNINRLQKDVHVCGRQTYNIDTEICCRGLLYPRRGPSTQCCGLMVYNVEQDLCCKGRTKRGKNRNDYMCCGRRVLDKSRHKSCRNRRLRVDDCQRRGYDKTRYLCCDGIIKRFQSRTEKCCGWDIYNTTNEKCCRRHFIVQKNKSCNRRLLTRHKRRRS